MGKKVTRSPIKDKPLRYPGQSLDEAIQKLFDEDIFPYLASSLFIVIITMMEWYRWYKETPYSPVMYTALSISFVLYSLFKVRKFRKRLDKLKLGRDGERVVGQYLDQLRMSGCRVFHDIIGDKFNLDHVIISQCGIFIIETKTYSKPESGRAEVHYDGKSIRVDTFDTGRKIIAQAESQVVWLKMMLEESTGKVYPIRPVIVFPGWYVKSSYTGTQSEPWVLNPKALSKFIGNTPVKLTEDEMMMASYHLSRFIRVNS
jgi:hypothetical protein